MPTLSEEEGAEEIARIIRGETSGPTECVLCEGKPRYYGVFVPKDPEAFGAEKSKQRWIVYALCEHCFGQPGVPEAVESKLRRELVSN